MTEATRPERILIDYDFTLFDTAASSQDLWNELAASCGKSPAEVEADSGQFYIDPVLGGYDYEGHVVSYGLEPKVMWKQLDEMFRSHDYLYPDGLPFIQELHAHGYSPSVLSFGEKRFQAAKIAPHVGALLPYDVVLRRKGLHIAEQYTSETGALIDDIPEQRLPAGFTEIHIDRGAAIRSPQQKLGGFVVANLEQAFDVLQSM